jgi:hypothetical protein
LSRRDLQGPARRRDLSVTVSPLRRSCQPERLRFESLSPPGSQNRDFLIAIVTSEGLRLCSTIAGINRHNTKTPSRFATGPVSPRLPAVSPSLQLEVLMVSQGSTSSTAVLDVTSSFPWDNICSRSLPAISLRLGHGHTTGMGAPQARCDSVLSLAQAVGMERIS